MKVVTKINVIEPGAQSAPEPAPYWLKSSTLVWFIITLVSLAVIYAL
ncbi:MAG: hypothetical protein JSS95_03875 [Acidobacteria bacterium]|nr:hypothetical protein [Acidobacteriota bacterium]